jgi:hypothetical protein
MIRSMLAAVALSVVAPAVLAQDATPDSANGRYTFSPRPNGVLRLDNRTGQVGLCTQRPAGWACEIAPSERTAFETEIGRLQRENAVLKRTLIAHNLPLPNGMQPPAAADAPSKSDALVLKLPDNAEMQRVVTFFQRAWRRFVEAVQGVQRGPDNDNDG